MGISEHLDSLIDWANVNNLPIHKMEFQLSSLVYEEFVKQYTPWDNTDIGYKIISYKNIPVVDSLRNGLEINLADK